MQKAQKMALGESGYQQLLGVPPRPVPMKCFICRTINGFLALGKNQRVSAVVLVATRAGTRIAAPLQ